jgi:hypothetical protein
MSIKKSISGIILGSLCSALLLSTAFAATPDSSKAMTKIQTTKPVYTWHTESENDPKSGQFDHCLVKNMYDNGTLMVLAQNNNGEKRLGLNFPQSKMKEGQHFDLAIQIDRRDVFPVEAVAITPQTMAIAIPDALPDQMRKGQLLHLRGPNDEVVFVLDGMDGAVMALQDCIISQKSKVHSPVMVASNEAPKAPVDEEETPEILPEAKTSAVLPTPPVALAKPAPVTTETKAKKIPPVITSLNNPIPDKILPPATTAPVTIPSSAPSTNPVGKLADKIEALQDNKVIEVATDPAFPQPWSGVFAGTVYAPDHLIPMKNKKPDQPLDYIWKKGDVFFGVKGKTIKPGDALATMSTDYLKMLKTRCAGNFVAQTSQSQQSAKTNTSWQVAEAACSNSSKGDSIAALIFAFTPQGGQIYFFESKAAQGPDAIKARDAVLKKVLQ